MTQENTGTLMDRGMERDSIRFKFHNLLKGKSFLWLGSKRLLIVGDGVLQYLPFAALLAPDTLGKEIIPYR